MNEQMQRGGVPGTPFLNSDINQIISTQGPMLASLHFIISLHKHCLVKLRFESIIILEFDILFCLVSFF